MFTGTFDRMWFLLRTQYHMWHNAASSDDNMNPNSDTHLRKVSINIEMSNLQMNSHGSNFCLKSVFGVSQEQK